MAKKKIEGKPPKGIQLGKYQIGKTLGEGNFGKVKLAKNVDSGLPFAVKVLVKSKITNPKINDQVRFWNKASAFGNQKGPVGVRTSGS